MFKQSDAGGLAKAPGGVSKQQRKGEREREMVLCRRVQVSRVVSLLNSPLPRELIQVQTCS